MKEYTSRNVQAIICLVLVVAGLLVSGCESREADQTASAGETRTFTDDLGREVEIPSSPTRVVSLAPSVTEIVFAAGAGDKLVAVTTADDYPPEVEGLSRVGAHPLNLEAVVAHKPDLVLATNQINSADDLDPLEQFGVAFVFFSFTSTDDVVRVIRTVGALLGTGDAAERAADSLLAGYQAIAEQTASTPADERPAVLALVGADVLYSFGGESYVNEMISIAGGRSLTSGLVGHSAVLNEEFVLSAAPDVIIGPAGETFGAEALLKYHPSFEAVPAVAGGSILSLPPDLLFRPGPRSLTGVQQIAAYLRSHSDGPS